MSRLIKKRVTHKKESDAELQVQESIEGIKKVFEKRQKMLATYGMAALGAAVVLGGVALYTFNAGDRAQQLEYEAYKVYYNLYQKAPLAGQDRAQKALELFQQAYEKKKSPRLLLFVADAHTELGKYDEALKDLEDFTQRYSREEALLPLAFQKMVALQLKKGSRPDALKTLDRLSAVPGDMLKDYALVQRARILEQDGKKDEALLKFKELAEKYPQSPYAEEAKVKSGEKKAG